jgi:hypothetical protein
VQVETSLHDKELVFPSTNDFNDDVQCNVKGKLDFDELKLISKQNLLIVECW